ncbi:uncharacterized protein MELLADRAFT_95884 [Melampsora larici-populina 98AG31]|uniref:Uncharacterized protein n=1 Tax=Melampsora larici-populina (strain 98AG31 / pathotype 3-4-7) TaxID=747676 RepID=F4RDL7_MELLP|nr:uncharacterized protein MELLADRAFT_95884 [Melampsora larici-populina 98AG31]EGG09422.1 hypothetical protein MELLADRAFT_95884 [Melampsora larici-populina 98AG31]
MGHSRPCYPSQPLPRIFPPDEVQSQRVDVNVQHGSLDSGPPTNSTPEMALGYQSTPSSHISYGHHPTYDNFQYDAHHQVPYGSPYETPHGSPYETPYETPYGLSQSQAYSPSSFMPVPSFQPQPSTVPAPAPAATVTPIPSPPEKRKRGRKAKPKPTEGPISEKVPVSQPSASNGVAESNAKTDYHCYWLMHKNENGQSAYSILVEWVIVPGNYNRWRAKDSKKKEVADEISTFLIERGITGRTADSCYCQVREIEKKYRLALEETKRTGGGSVGYPGEKSYDEKIEDMCPHFYELNAMMADRPSATPLDNIESMADLDEATSMEALRLPQKQSIVIDLDADDEIIPNDTADTDDEGFAIPPPLNRNALMQAIDGADKAVNLKPDKRQRVFSADDSSDSVRSKISSKKARNPNAGRFLTLIGIDSSPSQPTTSRKGANQTSPQDLFKFQEQASKQRDDLIEIQRDAVRVQADAGKDMGTAMKSMADTLKTIVTPDQTEAQMNKLKLKHMIKMQEAELVDKALERKAKLVERFALSGMSMIDANALADQMISEAEKSVAKVRESSPGEE